LLSIPLFRTGFKAERQLLQVHFAAAREFKEFEENFSMKAHALSARILGPVMLACFLLAGIAVAQEAQIEPGSERPMFTRLTPSLHNPKNIIEATATRLETWNGSFTYNGTTYNYNMVGVPPFPASSATITTYLIPVKLVLANGATYDPSTITSNTVASPIFASNVDFTSGGADMGKTQYIDAFQRANFWDWNGNTGNPSHLLLGLAQKPEVTLNVPSRYGAQAVVFGFEAGLVDINWFDSQAHSLLTSQGITPNTFAIFLTYDVYLTEHHFSTCCIGGYHSSTGSTSAPQSYAQATYVDHVGAFSQDVSALSHEVGEWADDPLVVNISGNNTPCGTLEVGDPLENNTNFGGYPYTVGGFTYNLQDLVTLPYFGAPTSTSVNGEFTFQGESLSVCQNGS
jgi:hypothetical protein